MVDLSLLTHYQQLIAKLLLVTILAEVPELIGLLSDVCCQYFEMVYLRVVDMIDPVD